jgi:lipopolysaccharide/colanic/teichoic acid biosynthesis glycosyltransferase
MTTSKIPTITTYSSGDRQQLDDQLPRCTLKWRQGQLLVNLEQHAKQPHLPSVESDRWLVECLQHSSVRLLRIDPAIGEASLRFWADVCQQADKLAFLQVPCTQELPSKLHPLSWSLKRLIDGSVAVLLLLTLSPVMLALVILLMRDQSSEPIFCKQWCIGERGKLFQRLKFPTINDPHFKWLGYWMRKYSLDKLPQLFNVLRGEMSLVGPCPWSLNDAVRFSTKGRQHLNALPGIVGASCVNLGQSKLLDLDAINLCNLEYLRSWSLWQDLKILLMTVPKVFSDLDYH